MRPIAATDREISKKGLQPAGGNQDKARQQVRTKQISASLATLLRTAEEKQTYGRLTLQIGVEAGKPVSLHSEVRESVKLDAA